MSYNKYYSPTTWEDFPSENTAINAQRLNHLEDGVDELDDRICALDVNKSRVSWNQQLLTGDKIAEISINGVVKNVYAPNVDGASQQAQAAALVSEGHAQGTQGGSAVGPGSQYYHNNAKYYAEQASASFNNKIASEGYALGTENGDPVSSGSVYYHNNAKFYAEEARNFTPEGYQELVDEVEEKIDKSDVDVKSVTTGKFDTITGGLMQKCIVDLEPVQSGSGTPSPSNVRAISGHTQVQVGNVGKNVFDEVYPNIESYTSATVAYKAIAVSNGTYTMSTNAPKNISQNANLFLLEGNVQTGASTVNNGVSVGISRTVESVNGYITVGYRMTDGVDPRNYNVQIEKGSSATDYEPYNGYTTTINLGGTYYGGTLDAVTGGLTVTDGFDDLGTLTWSTRYTGSVNKVVSANVSATYKTTNETKNLKCIASNYDYKQKVFGVDDLRYPDNFDVGIYSYSSNQTIIYLVIPVNDTPTGSFVYELATPTTIQLTPTQIDTLIGQNNVFTPLTGQSIEEVEFREVLAWDDVERAINVKLDLSSVAPIEYTNNASQSYNQKQLFIKDNKLCQALASISSGASFTENTNFKYTTLAEIIEPLL